MDNNNNSNHYDRDAFVQQLLSRIAQLEQQVQQQQILSPTTGQAAPATKPIKIEVIDLVECDSVSPPVGLEPAPSQPMVVKPEPESMPQLPAVVVKSEPQCSALADSLPPVGLGPAPSLPVVVKPEPESMPQLPAVVVKSEPQCSAVADSLALQQPTPLPSPAVAEFKVPSRDLTAKRSLKRAKIEPVPPPPPAAHPPVTTADETIQVIPPPQLVK